MDQKDFPRLALRPLEPAPASFERCPPVESALSKLFEEGEIRTILGDLTAGSAHSALERQSASSATSALDQELARRPWNDARSTGSEHANPRTMSALNLDADSSWFSDERHAAGKLALLSLVRAKIDAGARFSGSFVYPPGAYQSWHTNRNQPGWRLYIIVFTRTASSARGFGFSLS